MVLPFQPHRFQTAARHYVRGRLDYPPELIAWVASLAGLRLEHRVLDLGCGPGFLAAAFAPFVHEAVGLDPEPTMLEEAAVYTAGRGVSVKLLQASSYDLGGHLGTFQLVTMGRSFHWMDRAATLRALAPLVTAHGAVALFGDSHLEVPENAWNERLRQILEPHAERDPAHGARRRGNPDWQIHEAVLLESEFSYLRRISVVRRLRTPIEALIDRALSRSTTSPQTLGAEQKQVIAALRSALGEIATDGAVTEVVESKALLAFRTTEALRFSDDRSPRF